jgi:hypothetical protein
VGCFRGTSLTEVDLSGTVVEALGDHAFYGCGSLSRVIFPVHLRSIGVGCFWGTSLTEVDLSGTVVEALRGNAFYGCGSLSRVIFPERLRSIGAWCFEGTSLTQMDLSETELSVLSVASLGGCRTLSRIILPPCLLAMGERCFEASGLHFFWRDIWVPGNADGEGDAAASLSRASRADVVSRCGPSSVRSVDSARAGRATGVRLGPRALAGCAMLEEFVLPHGLCEVGEGVLDECCSLRWMDFVPAVVHRGPISTTPLPLSRVVLRDACQGGVFVGGNVIPPTALVISGAAAVGGVHARPVQPGS